MDLGSSAGPLLEHMARLCARPGHLLTAPERVHLTSPIVFCCLPPHQRKVMFSFSASHFSVRSILLVACLLKFSHINCAYLFSEFKFGPVSITIRVHQGLMLNLNVPSKKCKLCKTRRK